MGGTVFLHSQPVRRTAKTAVIAMPKNLFIFNMFFGNKYSKLFLTALLPLGGREAGFGLEGAEEGLL